MTQTANSTAVLPDEIWLEICLYLSLKECVPTMSCVNSAFGALLNSSRFWTQQMKQYNFILIPDNNSTTPTTPRLVSCLPNAQDQFKMFYKLKTFQHRLEVSPKSDEKPLPPMHGKVTNIRDKSKQCSEEHFFCSSLLLPAPSSSSSRLFKYASIKYRIINKPSSHFLRIGAMHYRLDELQEQKFKKKQETQLGDDAGSSSSETNDAEQGNSNNNNNNNNSSTITSDNTVQLPKLGNDCVLLNEKMKYVSPDARGCGFSDNGFVRQYHLEASLGKNGNTTNYTTGNSVRITIYNVDYLKDTFKSYIEDTKREIEAQHQQSKHLIAELRKRYAAEANCDGK